MSPLQEGEVMPEKVLILMVGLPRAGKSTCAATLSAAINAPIINPDSIRLALHGQQFSAEREPEVWNHAYLMAKSLFITGHSKVIVDATNNTAKRRDEWVNQVPEDVTVYAFIVDTPAEVCIERAKSINNDALLPVIERMDEQADWKGIIPFQPIRLDLIGSMDPQEINNMVIGRKSA